MGYITILILSGRVLSSHSLAMSQAFFADLPMKIRPFHRPKVAIVGGVIPLFPHCGFIPPLKSLNPHQPPHDTHRKNPHQIP
jgi:hypothetical protein